jgi:hypothetical protein
MGNQLGDPDIIAEMAAAYAELSPNKIGQTMQSTTRLQSVVTYISLSKTVTPTKRLRPDSSDTEYSEFTSDLDPSLRRPRSSQSIVPHIPLSITPAKRSRSDTSSDTEYSEFSPESSSRLRPAK